MRDWNVVVTLVPEGYRDALRILGRFGAVAGCEFRDVLLMHTDHEAHEFQENLRELLKSDATLGNAVARVIPVTERFSFRSAAEFRQNAQAAIAPWGPTLCGKAFYIRMHRRGLGGELNSHDEERALGEFLIGCSGAPDGARVSFEDPDVVIAIETIGHEAGLSRWSRAELERYALLRFD